ncbi:MAG: MFS transporter [Candidatus Aenigmarchaeota archaeon]|nr:MFS transporter [Candidatus Aenigmarchaeota archaeon]
MDETKGRLYSGATFGFLHVVLMAFAMIVPAFYFSSLNISIVTYGFLLTIGDVFSFLLKPYLGYLTDKYGERKFLLTCTFLFFITLFLIGFTDFLPNIVFLKIISGVASSLLYILIIIYGLRGVSEEPDKKVSTFGAIKESGWILGLLIPGLIIDKFGIKPAFYVIFVIGIIWFYFMYKLTKKYKDKPKVKVKASFSFLKKIPLLVILKSMDLAVFTAFLFFFTRFALQSLGLSRSIVSIIVITETFFFSFSQYLVGRVSNKSKRKYWVPACIICHLVGITIMLNASALPHYFLASILFGAAGGFIDVWLFSRISETVKKYDKGVFYGTFGWSYDIATIAGGQIPVLFVLLGLNQFTSMFVFPVIMLIGYLLIRKKD